MKLCTLVPIFDHGEAVGNVVAGLADTGLPCWIVDDGSGAETRRVLEDLEKQHAFVSVLRLPVNQGKGAALKAGYRHVHQLDFTHAIQLDADGQHDPADVARFVDAIQTTPEALVLGVPVFDESVPWVRLAARQLSRGLVWLACLSRVVPDPLCGFRAVPLATTVGVIDTVDTGNRMEFEPELAVRLVWEGTPVVPLDTRVVYPRGGRSHFSLRRDYPLLARVYLRLVAGMLARLPERWRARTAIQGA